MAGFGLLPIIICWENSWKTKLTINTITNILDDVVSLLVTIYLNGLGHCDDSVLA